MIRMLRWIVCIPAALAASVPAGGILYWLTSFIGGSTWYAWLLSGTALAVAFFAMAFWVAPAPNVALKWALVIIVGAMGSHGRPGAVDDRP
jgi:hypothetical protein